MQRSALCRSRRELSNEYLLAKIRFDTAENELIWFWLILVVSSDLILTERSHPTSGGICDSASAPPSRTAGRASWSRRPWPWSPRSRGPARKRTAPTARRSALLWAWTWARFIGGIDHDGWVVSDETSKHFHRKFAKLLYQNFMNFHNLNCQCSAEYLIIYILG